MLGIASSYEEAYHFKLAKGGILLEAVGGVILAAGKGTRMRSRLPKVLHKVAGEAMVAHVVRAARDAGINYLVAVVGFGKEMVRELLGPSVYYAEQEEQRGTGHALLQAEKVMPDTIKILVVLSGDVPLLTATTVNDLVSYHQTQGNTATVMTAVTEDPYGYGRVVRGDQGELRAVIEESDAPDDVKRIKEINAGCYCFNREEVFSALREIRPNPKNGEYYLTDVIRVLRERGQKVGAFVAPQSTEVLGINTRAELARAEKIMRARINHRLMDGGVTIIDPQTTFIDAAVEIEPDTVIFPFSFIRGHTVIGRDCLIGPHTVIDDSKIGHGVTVRMSYVESSEVGDGCQVGPFSYLRPETVLKARVKVGNFVEVKKSLVGEGSKIPHLSYIGDAIIGRQVNVGAGTITCNYDGHKKWPTYIEDGAFIGSNTNLVAPVRVGAGAVIGAGSTITKDVPSGALGIARGRQRNVAGWSRRVPETAGKSLGGPREDGL